MNVLQAKTIPRGIVMCPTPEAVVVYSDAIPMSYIYDYFDESVILKIMSYQHALKLRLHQQHRQEIAQIEANAATDRKNRWMERMQTLKQRQIDEQLSARQIQIMYEREILDEEFENQQNLEMRKIYARTRRLQLQEPFSMFCVLDDLSSDPDAIRSRVVKKLMDNGRHYLMLLIIACQYSMDFSAACRGGLDWVIIFFDTLQPNLKRLYDNYVGEFPDRHIFSEALAECARRNCCLCINKRSRSPDLYESVFLFAPQELWLSTKYFGDPQFEWVHNMFFSEEKFAQSLGGAANKPDEKKEKKKKAAALLKPPSKSFSIESIEKKHGRGGKAGKGGARGGAAGAGPKKKLTGSGQPQDYRPDAGTNSWGEDEDDFDPARDQKRKEQLQVKKNLTMLRQNLKAIGKQAQTQSQQQPDDYSYPPQSSPPAPGGPF